MSDITIGPVLVTGGTGNLGRRVVGKLSDGGYEVHTLSRRGATPTEGVTHLLGDTVRGIGLQAAVSNAAVVVHLAGGARGDDLAAGHLVRAARTTDIRHLVLISVIGADIMPINYFRMKLAAEEAVSTSGVPFTIIRVAQVHDFVRGALGVLTRFPLVPVPSGLRLEPVSAESVAQELVARALDEPSQRVPDLAGPEILEARHLVACFQRAREQRRWTVPVGLPGAAGRAYRRGDNLADQPVQRRGETWEEYLESVFPRDGNDQGPPDSLTKKTPG